METDCRGREIPHWRILYEAAVLESDGSKRLERITEAQQAIMDRMEDLRRAEDGAESIALLDGLNTLQNVRKMAARNGKLQEKMF